MKPQTCHQLASNLLPICFQLAANLLSTCYQLATNLLPTCYQLATKFLSTFSKVFYNNMLIQTYLKRFLISSLKLRGYSARCIKCIIDSKSGRFSVILQQSSYMILLSGSVQRVAKENVSKFGCVSLMSPLNDALFMQLKRWKILSLAAAFHE